MQTGAHVYANMYAGPTLAPMVRASYESMRALATLMGASLTYTQAIVGDCLRGAVMDIDRTRMMANVYTRVRSATSPSRIVLSVPVKDTSEKGCGHWEPTVPLVVQLTVNEHDDIPGICRLLAPLCTGIDLNLGCGAAFAVSGGRGQSLVAKSGSVVRRFVETLHVIEREEGRSVAFSVKQRLQETVQKTVDLVRDFYNSGAACVTIHMRQKGEDRKSTAANWGLFFEVLHDFYTWLWNDSCSRDLENLSDALSNFVIVANGDLCTREAIAEFFVISEQSLAKLPKELQPSLASRYGAQTPVMIARGAVFDLTLFAFINKIRGEKRATQANTETLEYLSLGAIPEVASLLTANIDKQPCFLLQAKALLEISDTLGSNIANYKYTVMQGMALARNYHLQSHTEKQLAYKHLNQALQAPKTYEEFRNLFNRLSSKPYNQWESTLNTDK